MSIDLTAKIIQFILAPVVMVTSCAILIGGMLTQYGALSDRLRLLARERLDLLRRPDGSIGLASQMADAYATERLRQIDTQIPQLLKRHALVHNAILAAYLAILGFIISMFVIASAALSSSPFAAAAALYIFLGATAVLLIGIAQIARDIRLSQAAVRYEAQRVLSLGMASAPGAEEQPAEEQSGDGRGPASAANAASAAQTGQDRAES